MYKHYFAFVLFYAWYLFQDLLVFRFDKMAPGSVYEACVYKTDTDGPLVSMNKSHLLQLYCTTYMRSN